MKRVKVKRKSERWVSNNRVLLGSSKKDPGRNPNFDTEETKLLISLWGDPALQRTLITTHRKHTVIVKLAEKMREYGYNRSAEEINTRIKNLKCFYNRLKKDIEMGLITAATWKHFTAMDEIMNRSIFSVRPNEIPKPSLKYQLEVEQTEQEERNKLRAAIAKAGKMSLLNAQNSEENISFSSNSSDDELLEDSDARMNCDESVLLEYVENADNVVKIKEEECSDSGSKDIEEVSLLIPKDEPFDEVDDVMEQQEPDTSKQPDPLTPRLADYIQLSSTTSNPITMPSTCRKLINGNITTSVQTPPTPTIKPAINQTILFANQPNAVSNAGKISLVPTNFLLQQNTPQPQQIQIRPQPQQRIICTQSNAPTNTGIVTSAGAGRMKVLLVNAFQNGKTTHAVAPKEATFTNTNLITTAGMHATTMHTVNTSDNAIPMNSTESTKHTRTEEPTPSKDPGMELLFNKLIGMQSENNEIQKQRLEIERQRLEFEKTIADKLLAALASLNQVQRPEHPSMPKSKEISTETEPNTNNTAHPPEFIDELNSFPLLTPKLEKVD